MNSARFFKTIQKTLRNRLRHMFLPQIRYFNNSPAHRKSYIVRRIS
jgi:hypothetical protein